MGKRIIICLAAVLALTLTVSFAGADAITLSGKTIPAETVLIYAPAGGTVESVNAEAGQKIGAGDVLYTMRTTKIYADRDGRIAGIFGQPGDETEAVTARYGAVMYIEESPAFTVTASTSGAYNSIETKYVHPGEYVYVISRNSASRYGEGVVTQVTGTDFSVEIREGIFLTGESVEVFRNKEYDYWQRIGKGNVAYSDPAAVTGGTGSIVSIAVTDGQEVKKGDLLMETLEGTFDAYAAAGTEIAAERGGVIGSISVQAGESTAKGAAAAEIYTLDRMRAEAEIPEDYINTVHEGDPVTVELSSDMNKRYEGTVVLISAVATEGGEETTYRVVAEFTPDDAVRFGMSVLITAGEEETPERNEQPEEKEEPAAEEEETQESGRRVRRERPEGMPAWNGEGELPEGMPVWNGDGELPEGMPAWNGNGGASEEIPEQNGESGQP